jgi:hypothetical protein
VADEFMRATQGPHTDGIELESTPGRSGSYGWTEREGMLRKTPGSPSSASASSASPPASASPSTSG